MSHESGNRAVYSNRIIAATGRYITACLAVIAILWGSAIVVSAQTQGVVTANKVNVRDAGSLTESNILYRVDNGEAVVILDAEGDFYRVNVRSDEQVYIAREYVKVIQTEGVVTQDAIWIYDIPSVTDAVPLGFLNTQDIITVTARCGTWLYISFNGVTGYVAQDAVSIPTYLSLTETNPQQSAGTETTNTSGSVFAEDVITYAKEFLGVKYIYGSMNPQKGFDCSGFVSYVLKHFDIAVNRNSASMAASNGTAVNRNELTMGDLVFFATSGGNRISHVGIYISNGDFIHASSWGEGVVIANLNDGYYAKCYVKATRVL